MTRSIPVEWTLFGVGPWDYSVNKANIYPFWVNGTERAKPYDWIYTVGMRGDGDGKDTRKCTFRSCSDALFVRTSDVWDEHSLTRGNYLRSTDDLERRLQHY